MLRALRVLLAIDAGLLFLLGALLIFEPRPVEAAFGFKDLPPGVDYIVGMWGCLFATLAIGYWIAARDPVRHIAWVQAGIARGMMEAAFGMVCLQRSIVTFHQAGFGILVASAIAVAYIALYPRKSTG